MRTQRTDVKKVMGSVLEMNVGGNVVVLDGERSHMQNKETNKKTMVNYEQGQCIMCVWVPVKEGEVVKETEKALKGNRFSTLATETEAQQDFTRRA